VTVIDGCNQRRPIGSGRSLSAPDSKHVAYLRGHDGKTFVVIDGIEAAAVHAASPDMQVMFDDAGTAQSSQQGKMISSA